MIHRFKSIHQVYKLTYVLLLFLIINNISIAQNIYRTACQGNLERLDTLLQATDINAQDYRGRSLLHWAVACKQTEAFELLVKRGIKINLKDHEDATPMHIAIRYNNLYLFERLVDLQVDTNWKVNLGASLLEPAIIKRDSLFVVKILEQGIDIDAKNSRGSTPLEISTRIKAKEISTLLISRGADENKIRHFEMKGAYMGQPNPGLEPQIFSPNFISTEESEFGSIFNADATEFYYGVDVNGKNEIRYSQRINNTWSDPSVVLPEDKYGYNDPFLSINEDRLYFISRRPLQGSSNSKDQDIWYVERTKDGWSEPINAGPNINSDRNEYYISFTNEGTMYFSSNVNAPEEQTNNYDIYYSRWVNNEFQEAVLLSDSINTADYEADVFIASDESYMIFCAIREEGFGRGDLYISFKKADGNWTKSMNMGEEINTNHHELCPFVTKDGKYFFYTSNQDIYWVDAKILERYRR